jgi:hypothetical protein
MTIGTLGQLFVMTLHRTDEATAARAGAACPS